LEAVEARAAVGIARRHGAARAGIAALEGDFADGKADNAALVVTKEMIFPERGQRFATGGAHSVDIDFESGAEALTSLLERDTGEPPGTRSKPFADGVERRGGDDGRAIGDGVVGKAIGGIANDNLLLEEDAEPFSGIFVGFREGERARGNAAAIARNRESNGAEVRGILGANDMDRRAALAIDPSAVKGIKSPHTVEGESTGGADVGFGYGNRVEGFDGMETNEGKSRSSNRGRHQKSVSKRVASGKRLGMRLHVTGDSRLAQTSSQ